MEGIQGNENDLPSNIKHATPYLDTVKTTFQERPEVYCQFLDMMKRFQGQQIDVPGAVERVSVLFNGHPSLIQGFDIFLPPDYRIECSPEPRGAKNNTAIISPPGAYAVPPEVNTQKSSRPTAPEPGPPPTTWVLDAAPYFDMVKAELEDEPTVYEQFMTLFEELEIETISMSTFVEQAASLFADHQTLIPGLGIFLPPSYSVGTMGVEQEATALPMLPAHLAPTPPSRPTWSRDPPHTGINPYIHDQSLAPSPKSLPFSDSTVLIDDVGLAITWLSSMPVKVNGHFCDVFEGIHVAVGKVALKRPRISLTDHYDGVARRFEREAETWRRLRHPHILEFLGTFKRDGHIYFVSPFINNGTLVDYITARPDINRIRPLCETADAVQYLHQEGVIHGDLKASNILVDNDGHSLLCDFGLTKTVDSRTSTAMRGAGTFRWQSPELWEDAPKTFKSDVYAFGMTIAEVLAGVVPFSRLKHDMAVMYAVMMRDERPPRIPAKSSSGICYESIWDVAVACWPKNPDDRIPMSEAHERIRGHPSLMLYNHQL